MLGRRGGRTRARRLPAEQRRQIAALGGKARQRSLEAARRLMANFNYLAMVDELRGGTPAVTAVKNFRGPLPGIYVHGSAAARTNRRRS
jgi:hypothetical protein